MTKISASTSRISNFGRVDGNEDDPNWAARADIYEFLDELASTWKLKTIFQSDGQQSATYGDTFTLEKVYPLVKKNIENLDSIVAFLEGLSCGEHAHSLSCIVGSACAQASLVRFLQRFQANASRLKKPNGDTNCPSGIAFFIIAPTTSAQSEDFEANVFTSAQFSALFDQCETGNRKSWGHPRRGCVWQKKQDFLRSFSQFFNSSRHLRRLLPSAFHLATGSVSALCSPHTSKCTYNLRPPSSTPGKAFHVAARATVPLVRSQTRS